MNDGGGKEEGGKGGRGERRKGGKEEEGKGGGGKKRRDGGRGEGRKGYSKHGYLPLLLLTEKAEVTIKHREREVTPISVEG